MSTLVFVRHGQASLFQADYDQLSDPGQEQSRELGRYLSAKDLRFDEVYIGPRRRHRQTADLAAEHAGGLSIPFEEVPEFDEHHVDQLVSHHLDDIVAAFPHVGDHRAAFHAVTDDTQKPPAFARLFEAVSDLWVSGEAPSFGVETWMEFRGRVNRGIDRIVSRPGSGRTVVVFASAGTIVAALHRALQCPDRVALELGWRIWNCSVTSFAFSGQRFTLDRFNSMSHLEAPEHWTYR